MVAPAWVVQHPHSARERGATNRAHGIFIDAYTRVHGRPPAETDMQRHFGVSPPSVHRRQPGVARSIEVLLAPEDLPVLRHPEPVKSSVPRNYLVSCHPREPGGFGEGSWLKRSPVWLKRHAQRHFPPFVASQYFGIVIS